MREPASTGTLEIYDKGELAFGPACREFLAKLHDLEKQKTPIDLTVHFKSEIVYVHGLALLAAWCDRFAARVTLKANHAKTQRYLEETGYRRALEDHVAIDEAVYDGGHVVALTRIDPEDERAANRIEIVAGRIVDLFGRHMAIDNLQRDALIVTFAELVENVYRHAKSRYLGYVMAQAFPKARRLHIVVVDTGIGIQRSFRESESESLRSRARNERDAIDLALEKLVTSKSSGHAGYGLYVVRRLVEGNHGQFRLMSGRITREISETGTWIRKRRDDKILQHQPWGGTEVSVVFRLDQPLPLLEVYGELGPRDKDDFFDS